MIKKFGTVVATAAMFASVMAPAAFAETTVIVSGNGAKSDNTVKVENENKIEVWQGNVTVAKTYIEQDGNSGGNNCSGNTGGGCTIDTGKVTNKAEVVVQGGDNKVILPDPCGCDEDTTVKVKNNGYKSDTYVKVENENKTKVGQFNGTFAFTGIGQYGDSGNNKAKYNTAKHSKNKITTGDVKNVAHVAVVSGNNTVK